MGKQKVICSLLASRVKGRFVIGPHSKVNWGLKNFSNTVLTSRFMYSYCYTYRRLKLCKMFAYQDLMSMEKVPFFSPDNIGEFLSSKFCWAKKKINTDGLLRLNISTFILFPFCEFEYFLWFLQNDNEVNCLGYAANVNCRVLAKTKL